MIHLKLVPFLPFLFIPVQMAVLRCFRVVFFFSLQNPYFPSEIPKHLVLYVTIICNSYTILHTFYLLALKKNHIVVRNYQGHFLQKNYVLTGFFNFYYGNTWPIRIRKPIWLQLVSATIFQTAGNILHIKLGLKIHSKQSSTKEEIPKQL